MMTKETRSHSSPEPGEGQREPAGLLKTTSITQTFRHEVYKVYKRVFLEFMLREKTLPPSKDGRQIPLDAGRAAHLMDERRGHQYIDNSIRTSRYTVYDFLPKQLIFQFSRIGNFYFLCVGVPQTIPGLSTTGNYTTILPLMFFVLLTIAKEGYDDYKRHRLDKVENAYEVMVLKNASAKCDVHARYSGKRQSRMPFPFPFYTKKVWKPRRKFDEEYDGLRWIATKWCDVKVGDVINLERDEPVPADIVLLHTVGEGEGEGEGEGKDESENKLAHIETMALDGETNLKSKHVSALIQGCGTIEGVTKCRAHFVTEDPNPHLYRFDGKVTVDDETLPLTLKEIVYRGSILRNTRRAVGLVVNTGEECKIRMNANQHPKAKRPELETMANKIVVTLAIYVIVLSVGCSVGYTKWQETTEDDSWYLDHARVPFYQIFIAYIIQFNNVIPLALYVSLEIIKIGQLLMLNSDLEMYDEATDTPAKCNTNTILENLGQIGYIFSDKTGTLTENVMKFRKLSIAGTSWLHEADLETKVDDGVHSLQPPPPTCSGAPRPSLGARRWSQWRSTGRPDHVQPDVTTRDLIEYMRLQPHSFLARKAKQYVLAMALCHTCLPETRDGELAYQASSPDELALVSAAKELGYTVVKRSSQSITLEIVGENGKLSTQTYDILDVIEFSSKRKRMSVVLRFPDGRVCLICKGADSVILPRLKMAGLAMQRAAHVRKSADMEHEVLRRSLQEPRARPRPRPRPRPSATRSKSFEVGKIVPVPVPVPEPEHMQREGARLSLSLPTRGVSFDTSSPQTATQTQGPEKFAFLEDGPAAAAADESAVFTRCFKHLDDFATEGLRTLVFARRFIAEADYTAWKKIYRDAETSLVDRQERIEAAGEMMEQSMDLVGASAIEDKLQEGVPETIDKLRRAGIKIWMLTGDKRETAINIAHSARICQPASDLYVLDATKGSLDSQLHTVTEDIQTESVHSVVVIDGHTLSVVEKSADLSAQFFAVMLLVDSVICCRASPAQKSLLVRTVRSRLRKAKGSKNHGLTLAIGDGANDLAMIQSSHVGVGISGKEGLQAARVADYAIAQFRFLQRLLLVHGRWNYVRTARFILATFWKELFFYLPTALYQRYNGYTGTSLYEYASLTVFNTLFTSLCVICMGVWEQDLKAETLLAVPELYVFGQRDMGLNMWKYLRWMMLGAVQGVVAWFGVWAGYGWKARESDQNLFALGDLSFTVGVLWINWKLFIFETHYKSGIVLFCFFLTTLGWWAWNAFLCGVYARANPIYKVRDGFTNTFGPDPLWWATLFAVLGVLGLMELCLKIAKRRLIGMGLYNWPFWRRGGEDESEWEVEVWQELEREESVRERLRAATMARDAVGTDPGLGIDAGGGVRATATGGDAVGMGVDVGARGRWDSHTESVRGT